MAQKYIINNNTLILGNVEYHSELSKDHSKTQGGGYWHVDTQHKKVYLYSRSLDYNRPKITDVIYALRHSVISPTLEGYSFYYSSQESLSNAMHDCFKVL